MPLSKSLVAVGKILNVSGKRESCSDDELGIIEKVVQDKEKCIGGGV